MNFLKYLKKFFQCKSKNSEKQYKINLIGENDRFRFIGSHIGMTMLMILIMMILYLFIKFMIELHDSSKDIIQVNEFPNTFQEMNEIDVNQYNIMPFVEILKMNDGPSNDFDIYTNEQKTHIDYQKLQNYLTINLLMEVRIASQSVMENIQYEVCTEQHFIKKGISKHQSTNEFCPPLYIENYILMNGYSNQEIRKSFMIQILKCNPSLNQNCKSDSEIQLLLENIFMTVYSITESVDFNSKELYMKRPIISKIQFISQFQLSISKYRDQNIYVYYNNVRTKDNRYNFFQQYQEYSFFNYELMPAWEGSKAVYAKIIRQGNSLIEQTDQVFYGCYFFLNDYKRHHSRQSYNIQHMSSEFLGIVNFLFTFFVLLSIDLNYNMIIGEFINKMYFPIIHFKIYQEFQKYDDAENLIKKEKKKLEFNLIDKLYDIFWLYPLMFFFKRYRNNQKMFANLKEQTEQQMNLINMLSRLQKLVVLVTCIMKNQQFRDMKNEAETQFRNYIASSSKINSNEYNIYEYIDQLGYVDEHKFTKKFVNKWKSKLKKKSNDKLLDKRLDQITQVFLNERQNYFYKIKSILKIYFDKWVMSTYKSLRDKKFHVKIIIFRDIKKFRLNNPILTKIEYLCIYSIIFKIDYYIIMNQKIKIEQYRFMNEQTHQFLKWCIIIYNSLIQFNLDKFIK